MREESQRGPLLADEETVYRALLYPSWFSEKDQRVSSAAFDDPVFSVDRASKCTPHESAARFRNVNRVAEFQCGPARSIGFEVRDELDPDHPENLAHAHVYFLEYDCLKTKYRKAKARRLAELCVCHHVGAI